MVRLYSNDHACTSIVRQTAILMGSAASGRDAQSSVVTELCGWPYAAAYGRFDGGRIVIGAIPAASVITCDHQASYADGIVRALQAGRAGKGGAFLGDHLRPQWLGQCGQFQYLCQLLADGQCQRRMALLCG